MNKKQGLEECAITPNLQKSDSKGSDYETENEWKKG